MISLQELDAVKEEPINENIPKIVITGEQRNSSSDTIEHERGRGDASSKELNDSIEIA